MTTLTMRRVRKPLHKRLRWARILPLIAGALLVSGFAYSTFSSIETVAEEYVYVVKPGDSLWSIAHKNVGESKDIREEVYNIKMRNNINTHMRDIQPGDKLVLNKKRPQSTDMD